MVHERHIQSHHEGKSLILEGIVEGLFTYPVKGLTAQYIPKVTLKAGQGFPDDRIFGFTYSDSGFNPSEPEPMPKDRFIMCMKEERLAGLTTFLDPVTLDFTIKVAGHLVLQVNFNSEQGRVDAEHFFTRMFELTPDRAPRLVRADPHRFTDVSVLSPALMNAVSLINLNSVADLEKNVGHEVDPRRFRGNILFSGWPPFAELGLLGKIISLGTATARVTMKTRRCAATDVNPVTAKRDMTLPKTLMLKYGHADMGIYVEVITPGTLAPGDHIAFNSK